jgi:hypothetical protein
MMNEKDLGTFFHLVFVVFLIIGLPMLLILLLILQPYFEARAFNKFTQGAKATYWDAVWTDLRVTPK